VAEEELLLGSCLSNLLSVPKLGHLEVPHLLDDDALPKGGSGSRRRGVEADLDLAEDDALVGGEGGERAAKESVLPAHRRHCLGVDSARERLTCGSVGQQAVLDPKDPVALRIAKVRAIRAHLPRRGDDQAQLNRRAGHGHRDHPVQAVERLSGRAPRLVVEPAVVLTERAE